MTDFSAPGGLSFPTVLIVDDQEDARDSLADLLELEGYQAATAVDGGDALAYLERCAPAAPRLILLDLMMPRINGWEFRRLQLADPRFRDIPVIITSGADRTEQAESALQASGYFVKPIDPATLLRTVNTFCGVPE